MLLAGTPVNHLVTYSGMSFSLIIITMIIATINIFII